MQTRSIRDALKDSFRFVFVDAPIFCEAGPDVTVVFGECGPFRRWLRWLPEHEEIEADVAIGLIEASLKKAMDGDKGTGEWVGLLGFSQGAKIAASLLFRRQVRMEMGVEEGTGWRFAVLMAGRGPLVSLEPEGVMVPGLSEASEDGTEGIPHYEVFGRGGRLRMPTLHVHGLLDEGLILHRKMLERCCEKGRYVQSSREVKLCRSWRREKLRGS